MEFSKNGYMIYINKNDEESWDMFFDRGWFIVSQLSESKIHHDCKEVNASLEQPDIYQDTSEDINTYEDICRMALIWLNVKYRNCKYNIDIINKLKKMTKNLDMY